MDQRHWKQGDLSGVREKCGRKDRIWGDDADIQHDVAASSLEREGGSRSVVTKDQIMPVLVCPGCYNKRS